MQGELGNTLGLWTESKQVVAAGKSAAAIRCMIPQKEFVYHIPVDQLDAERDAYCKRNNVFKEYVVFAEHDAGFVRQFSGEWWADTSGSILHYSFKNKNMRQLMNDGPYFEHYAEGMKANSVLRMNMDEDQVNWLWHLHRKFHSPVVEFSLFTKPLGIMHDRLVIWEARHY